MEVEMINGGERNQNCGVSIVWEKNSPEVSSSILKQALAVPAERQVSRCLLLFLNF